MSKSWCILVAADVAKAGATIVLVVFVVLVYIIGSRGWRRAENLQKRKSTHLLWHRSSLRKVRTQTFLKKTISWPKTFCTAHCGEEMALQTKLQLCCVALESWRVLGNGGHILIGTFIYQILDLSENFVAGLFFAMFSSNAVSAELTQTSYQHILFFVEQSVFSVVKGWSCNVPPQAVVSGVYMTILFGLETFALFVGKLYVFWYLWIAFFREPLNFTWQPSVLPAVVQILAFPSFWKGNSDQINEVGAACLHFDEGWRSLGFWMQPAIELWIQGKNQIVVWFVLSLDLFRGWRNQNDVSELCHQLGMHDKTWKDKIENQIRRTNIKK